MKPFRSRSTVEQLADHLREEMKSGAWGDAMPGVAKLSHGLGVGTRTVVAALQILKREGLLQGDGERKRSRIISDAGIRKPDGLRIRILQYDVDDEHDEHMVALRYRLGENGHHVAMAPKTLSELKFDVKRVARMVEKSAGDAWVVRAGPRPVLEWFAARPVPAFAMFGRQTDIPMASVANLKSPALAEALRRLVDLGHRRIVLLTREDRRKPTPGLMERRFLEELERLGVPVGAYNLPDWEDHKGSFQLCLEGLFRHTAPSVLIVSEPTFLFATQQFLTRRRLSVPEDVSMLALDDHPAFRWFAPEVSRIQTDSRRWVARVVEWADNVANGREDRRETLIRSQFVEGATIAAAAPPARKENQQV
jgi:DNA-binding LacI/PurR family transcriptional regulator/DNA-binding transcriptional regulator YhcF (GntR family)